MSKAILLHYQFSMWQLITILLKIFSGDTTEIGESALKILFTF